MNKKTDYELAMAHKYVTVHGRKPAEGVTTTLSMLNKPALVWSAAEITARFTYETLTGGLLEDVADTVKPYAMVKNAMGEKVKAKEATLLDKFLHACRAEHKRRWDAKADLGSRVHDHALDWALGKEIEILEDEVAWMQCVEKFFVMYQPKFLYVEEVVVNPSPMGDDSLEYGGRFDAIVEIDGKTYLIDYKTGSPGYPVDKALQGAAYAHCEIAQYNESGDLVGTLPLPPLDGLRTVYFNGTGDDPIVEDPLANTTLEEAYDCFINLKKARQWVKKVESAQSDL